MGSHDFAWRAEWAFRTGLTTVVLAAVMLFTDMYNALQFRVKSDPSGVVPGGPSFAGFVCLLVADVTFGRTLINAWSVFLVIVPVLLITAAPLAAGTHFGPQIGLPLLAALSFFVQMLNLHPMGKKVGISLLCLMMIAPPGPLAFQRPLSLMCSVLFGLGMAFVGLLFPWPRLAANELHSRLRYFAAALREVCHSLLAGLYGDQMARSSKAADRRREMLEFVQTNIVMSTTRLAESRCGPRRRKALQEDAAMLRTLDEVLMSAKVMNEIYYGMEFGKFPCYDMLMSNTRPALSQLDESLSEALALLANPAPSDGKRVAVSQALHAHADTFDQAFHDARRAVFFKLEAEPIEPRVLTTLYALLFELDVVVGTLCAFFRDAAIVKPLHCCRGTLASDLFLPQQHLRDLFELPWKPETWRWVIAAFKLTLALVIAGIYGYYAFPEPNSLAAYTIAYVGTDLQAGSNMLFSLHRGMGTVTAAVYAELVLMASAHMDEVSRHGFAIAAMFVFVVPSTYIRSSPSVSYAGNVAAFTCVLLLLDVRSGGEQAKTIAHRRVLDTFFGVFIFGVIDLLIYPARSDSQMYAQVGTALRAIRTEVLDFGRAFQATLAGGAAGGGAASPVARADVSDDGEDDSDGEPSGGESASEDGADVEFGPSGHPRPKRYALQGLPSHAQRVGRVSAQRVLLNNALQEPNLWRAQVNRVCMERVLDVELGLGLKSLQLTRIAHHAILADSRLTAPTVFEAMQDPRTRSRVMAPMSHAFDELFGCLPDWVDHLLDAVQALDENVADHYLEDEVAALYTGREEDALRADAVALTKADKHLCDAFAEVIRRNQVEFLNEARMCQNRDMYIGALEIPPNTEVKVVSALMHASRGIFTGLLDLEAPLVRAQASRVLDFTQRPVGTLGRAFGRGGQAPRKLPALRTDAVSVPAARDSSWELR